VNSAESLARDLQAEFCIDHRAGGSPCSDEHLTEFINRYSKLNADAVRHLLENFASAFHVCQTETQRRRVVDHAIKTMAQLTPDQLQRRELIPDPDSAKLEGSDPHGPH